MLIKCDYCGIDKEMKPYKVARSVHNYCSRKCAQTASRKRVTVICNTCGKEVEKNPSDIVDGRGTFCSKSCAATKTVDIQLEIGLEAKVHILLGLKENMAKYVINAGMLSIQKY